MVAINAQHKLPSTYTSQPKGPDYKVIKLVFRVAYPVPPRSAKWRVGVYNSATGKVTPFGEGEEAINKGLSYRPSLGERIYFQVGKLLKGGDKRVINLSFYGLKTEDFGKTISFNVEVKEKIINPNRIFTELSFSRSQKSAKKELRFEISGAGGETINIRGSSFVANFKRLQ